MRIIDYFNYLATAMYFLVIVAAIIKKKKNTKAFVSGKMTNALFLLILLVAAGLRLYKLGSIPYGLQQDEASIGYEAYILANFGIDRNGYPWPVYPITWGCGGGSPLLIYLNVLSIKLFGTGIVKLRLIPAVCGVLTVALFYFTLKLALENNKFQNELSLLGAGLLAICPWHIILSRWSLDCNIMPFNLMLAVYLFVLAVMKKSTCLYVISSIAFAVCMYSYGSATIVVPLFLVFISIYCLAKKLIRPGLLVKCIIAFVIVFAPLMWFYGVNYLGLPEVFASSFTINRFTSARTGEALLSLSDIPAKLPENLASLFLSVSVGDKNATIAHFYPGYAILYKFTFPITFLGLFLGIKDMRKELSDAVFVLLLLANIILCIVIVPDTNRMVMVYVAFIYFFVKGADFVIEKSGKLFVIVIMFLLMGALSFAKDYFGDYNFYATSIFMPGYGDAAKRAYEIAGDDNMVYSTYDGLSSPFMLALYYTEYDPHKYIDTVNYRNEKDEFRVAESFGNFDFRLPENIKDSSYNNDVFVLSSNDLSMIEGDSSYTIEDFEGYHVVYKSGVY
ncbi:ArnT family glycosyltransferase [Butyrivibrio sp. VCB2006]|uniref:ArnT family glycosyltransferase n=1 Tax=Butyrivibrio sp. VCB2006 TaxID=1280679 RepID=UPI00040C8CDC|nr:glycosyltransferase family 39 protein [Butyrivibrio sp. VCB2006]